MNDQITRVNVGSVCLCTNTSLLKLYINPNPKPTWLGLGKDTFFVA